MSDEPFQLWQAALKVLAAQVSRANYDTWLEGTVGVRFEDDVLTVGTRSEFVTEWLQKRLRPAILRTLAEIHGNSIEIRFEPIHTEEAQVSALNGPAGESSRLAPPRPRLRERYTFENYIVGPGNRLAFATAEGVARDPGRLYNPLFVYGAAGLGKTHLLHAIGHSLVEKGLHVVYLSAEAFTNALITSIQQRKMDD
ncbi:MAG: DnaA/Hda family protein, partial [Dehalococcoidia bacterium]